MITIFRALQIIKGEIAALSSETIELGNSVGRILVEKIRADSDLPPFNRSQMDGYAVISVDAQTVPARFKIVGESAAGKSWAGELKTGEAVRIMTGAAVPAGADAVQKLEVAREENGFVELFEPVKAGQNTVARAAEIKQNTVLFETGEIINKQMIAGLASFGYDQIKVGNRPRAAVLATGNELVSIAQKPGEDQIRDSNSATLRAFAESCGALVETLAQTGDDLEQLKTQIKNAVETCDVLILSGGVSVGKYDFTKTALIELGAEILFEKVALRPGKPTVFAKLNDKLVFGLPGNPVSVIVTFNLFVRPALLKMQGATEIELKSGFAVVTKDLKGAAERDSFLPARLSTDERGQLLCEPLKWGGSSDFVAFARADALVFVPRATVIKNGDAAKILFL